MRPAPTGPRSGLRLAALAMAVGGVLAACQTQHRTAAEVPTDYDPRETELAFAAPVADAATLDGTRGGFLVFNGMQIDLTFELTTTLGRIDAITSMLTLDDILSGRAGLITTADGTSRQAAGSVVVDGVDGATEILHIANPLDGVQAVINNTASGAEVMTVVNTTMEIVMPRNPRIGQDLPIGRDIVGPELQRSIISGLPR